MDQAGDALPIAELLDERQRLLDVACWMLGRCHEAESVVAETYRQWYSLSEPDRERIADPLSWLAKTTGAICLAGLAPPERRSADLQAKDVRSGQRDGSVAERARNSLRARRARATTTRQHDLVVRAVGQACADEDGGRLASLLAADVAAFFDGGGKVRALTRPVHGRLRVSRSLLALLARHPSTTMVPHSVNGRTGLIVRYEHRVVAVICLDIAGPHVVQVWVVLNPDKLRLWNRPELAPGTPGPQDNASS